MNLHTFVPALVTALGEGAKLIEVSNETYASILLDDIRVGFYKDAYRGRLRASLVAPEYTRPSGSKQQMPMENAPITFALDRTPESVARDLRRRLLTPAACEDYAQALERAKAYGDHANSNVQRALRIRELLKGLCHPPRERDDPTEILVHKIGKLKVGETVRFDSFYATEAQAIAILKIMHPIAL